jgi:hypothetical protein
VREVREGIKFLGKCLLLPVKEIKECFLNDKDIKKINN